jgi:hypothetical protein
MVMSKLQITIKGLALAIIASSLSVVPASAQNHDYFAHNVPTLPSAPKATEEKPLLGAMAMCSPRTPVVAWFETFDTTVFTLKVPDADKAMLSRPFNREAQRVQEWIDTASQVAKKYRLLATTIRRMEVPGTAGDLQQFRNLNADWYTDVAGVYEDLIRPRTPPKTKEELDDQLGDITQRADSLKGLRQTLQVMDINLRKEYKVHANKETDALTRYVNGR